MRWKREIFGVSWEKYLSSSYLKSDQHFTCRKKAPFVFTFTNVEVVQRTTTTLDVWRESTIDDD